MVKRLREHRLYSNWIENRSNLLKNYAYGFIVITPLGRTEWYMSKSDAYHVYPSLRQPADPRNDSLLILNILNEQFRLKPLREYVSSRSDKSRVRSFGKLR